MVIELFSLQAEVALSILIGISLAQTAMFEDSQVSV